MKTITSQKIKVLLVDDDTKLGNGIIVALNKRGFETTYLSSLYGMSEVIDKLHPDALVLDVEIGDENGIKMVQNLFKGDPSLPIIFISSHHEDELKEEGLGVGAVAYLDKPFSIKLLVAYICRFVRMTKSNVGFFSNIIHVNSIHLDTKNRALNFEDGTIVDLRPMEFNIMQKLVTNLNEIVSREDMYIAIWGGETAYYNEPSLNNYIRRLRNILARDDMVEIFVQRGLGFKLKVKTET